jgi:hypothetical protein
VSGIDGTSRNNKRPRGVADAFQVRKDIVEFHRDDSSNILTNEPSGLCPVNNSEHFRPERTLIFRASSLPGDTERLARKSPCEKVNPGVVGSVEGENVGMQSRATTVSRFGNLSALFAIASGVMFAAIALQFRGVGQNRSEPFFKDLLCIFVFFTERHRFVTAILGCDCEPTYTRKNVKMRSHLPMPSLNRAAACLAAAAMRSASSGAVMAATVARILANSSRARSRETR